LNVRRALFAAALVLAVSAACSSGPGTTPPPSTTGPASSQVASTVSVVLTPADCNPDPAYVRAGSVTFNVTNQGADAVSELELKRGETTVAEKENLTPGLSGSFTAQLEPGTYALECPGATTAEAEFRVTE